MTSMTLLGEAKFQRQSATFGPLLAVANATRTVDYFAVLRAPNDVPRGVSVPRVKLDPNATHAAAATNYITLQMVKVRGTTVTAVGTTVTTNTGGGWTSLTEKDLIRPQDNVKLSTGERLMLRISNTGNGVASNGFGIHADYEIL